MFDLGSYTECRVLGEEGSEASELICKTMFAWREAVSPHLAAERENGLVGDSTVLEVLQRCLESGLKGGLAKQNMNVFSVVETAGGVASPGSSGTLQCDLYRYFCTFLVWFSVLVSLLILFKHSLDRCFILVTTNITRKLVITLGILPR